MATVFDVAAYVLAKGGPMTAMKLQKLVYYSQAWHLVWEEQELFTEPIEAWANGPVVRDLYNRHRQRWTLDATDTLGGDPTRLTAAERETIDLIVTSYGQHEPHWLSELTKREPPWRDTRAASGLHPMDRGAAVMPTAAIYEYYDGLTEYDDDCVDV
jgi:uncharacterized phage-associated protein